jgi:hypothetical protein
MTPDHAHKTARCLYLRRELASLLCLNPIKVLLKMTCERFNHILRQVVLAAECECCCLRPITQIVSGLFIKTNHRPDALLDTALSLYRKTARQHVLSTK